MIRLAGTMELSGLNHDVRQERVAAIARSATWAIRGWPERTPTSGPGVRVWIELRPMIVVAAQGQRQLVTSEPVDEWGRGHQDRRSRLRLRRY
jgi:hypothetical protein